MATRRKRRASSIVALVVALAAAISLLAAGGVGAGSRSAFALPRAQTFYMSGSQWAPYGDVNPAKTWDYSTGTVGLAYETAFRFNPLTGNFIPWLATNGTWRTKSQYVMTIRTGVKFSDGKTLRPKDVKYSFDLLKIPTHPQNALWATTGLQSVRAVRNTVVFTFAGKPGYQQFDFYRYNVAIVPQHVFSTFSKTDITTGNLDASQIVATGPYAYQSGASSTSQTFVWQRRNDWWATKLLGLKPAPRYVVDIHNSSNTAALANFQAGNIDLFNNFAPKSAIKGNLKTFYPKAPYHLGANTTWLFPNTTKKPLNDPQFRRALAFSINMNQILDKAYQGLVDKASPTGLLPIWNKWIDKKAVAKLGFSYNLTRAKAILAAAGYKDTDNDGYVENKDGSDISLTIQCPNGWSDWMIAIQVISESAKAAGIKVTPGYPDYGTLVDDRGHARYDLDPGQRQAVLEHAVDVLPVHLPAADPGQPDDGELRAVPEPEGVEPHAATGQDTVNQPEGLQGRDVAAPDRVHAEPARDTPLVQRDVGDVQHEVLDGLAVGIRRDVHAYGLEQLLADDEHRHAHASEAGQGQVETAPMDTRHPSRRPAGRGVAFTADVVDVEARWGDTLHGRS